ncbi:MAG TPA: hypothetical protein VIC26_00960, partial [Marinagarivorans sp.]
QYVYAVIDGEKQRFWYAGKREPGLHAELSPPAAAVGLVCDIEQENEFVDQGVGFIGSKCKWKTIRK